jgi:sugar lactone lactonase YvrE
LKILLLTLVVIVGYLSLWPVPIRPVAWTPPADPGPTGDFTPRLVLDRSETLIDGVGLGPEDVTRGPDGFFYTGLLDGRIIRFDEDEWMMVADTDGRPLGMQFDRRGNLIVADADRGLLSIAGLLGGAPTARVTVLADSVDGQRMRLVDDLDIAADGTIWFSDASRRFDVHHWQLDALEGQPTGRLLSYAPASGQLSVHLDALRFANGVALGPDDAFVLVNETLAARITRLWLKGPKAGTSDVFLDGLPGYPDTLSFDGRYTFWVAIPSPRLTAVEQMAGRPWLRAMLMRLPASVRSIELPPMGWVLGVATDGTVRYSLRDETGRCFTVTSVNRIEDALLMGSIGMARVCRFDLRGL